MNAIAFVETMLFISKKSWFQPGLWSWSPEPVPKILISETRA